MIVAIAPDLESALAAIRRTCDYCMGSFSNDNPTEVVDIGPAECIPRAWLTWGGTVQTWWDSNGNIHMKLLSDNSIMGFNHFDNVVLSARFCELYQGKTFHGIFGCSKATTKAYYEWIDSQEGSSK
jgi:hypothetical protein